MRMKAKTYGINFLHFVINKSIIEGAIACIPVSMPMGAKKRPPALKKLFLEVNQF